MRAVAPLLAVLLLLAPLGLAQGDPGSPRPADRPDRDCAQANQTRDCPADPGGDCAGNATCADGNATPPERGPWAAWCREEDHGDRQRERCREALQDFQQDRDNRWVSFTVDAANQTLLDYRVGGKPTLASVALDSGSGDLSVRRAGSTLRLGDADTELALHDDPTGLVRFKGADGNVTVRFADEVRVDRAVDGRVARLTFPDGRVGHLNSDNATWLDARTVHASGFFSFLLPPERDGDVVPRETPQMKQQVAQAIERRHIGAEVKVSAPAVSSIAAASASESVQVLAYDDVHVEVAVPDAAATPDNPVRVVVSSELQEGRTIVLALDRAVLDSSDPAHLVLRYFDLHPQADGSTVETEVVFRMASDLEDVLDPTDDAGQPEYWIVQDANGLQILTSVPHWSAHAITVGSLAAFVPGNPSVVLGIAAGAAASVVAAVALLWPRRPDHE